MDHRLGSEFDDDWTPGFQWMLDGLCPGSHKNSMTMDDRLGLGHRPKFDDDWIRAWAVDRDD